MAAFSTTLAHILSFRVLATAGAVTVTRNLPRPVSATFLNSWRSVSSLIRKHSVGIGPDRAGAGLYQGKALHGMAPWACLSACSGGLARDDQNTPRTLTVRLKFCVAAMRRNVDQTHSSLAHFTICPRVLSTSTFIACMRLQPLQRPRHQAKPVARLKRQTTPVRHLALDSYWRKVHREAKDNAPGVGLEWNERAVALHQRDL